MNETNETHDETAQRKLDQLIKSHLVERAEREDDGRPVAAVSASDRFSWAKKTSVPLEDVDRRIEEVCDKLPEQQRKHWAVPRYRWKGDLA